MFPSISDFTSGLKYEDLLLMPKFLHLCQMRSDKNYSVWLPNYWWWPKYASDGSCFTFGKFWILSLALVSSEISEYWEHVHYWGGVKVWPCLMQEKISRKGDIKMSFQCVLVSWCILNFTYAFWDQKSLMCTSVFYLSNLSQLLHPWALSACFVNDQKKILFGTKATAAIYLVVISAEPHSAELCQDLIRVLIQANSLQCPPKRNS